MGAIWKVFAVDSYDSGPIGVVQVEELRHNPPSHQAVSVRNRGAADRQEPEARPGLGAADQDRPHHPRPYGRVVFYVSELTTHAPWKSEDVVAG